MSIDIKEIDKKMCDVEESTSPSTSYMWTSGILLDSPNNIPSKAITSSTPKLRLPIISSRKTLKSEESKKLPTEITMSQVAILASKSLPGQAKYFIIYNDVVHKDGVLKSRASFYADFESFLTGLKNKIDDSPGEWEICDYTESIDKFYAWCTRPEKDQLLLIEVCDDYWTEIFTSPLSANEQVEVKNALQSKVLQK
jgi:hypothetical protein